MSININYRNKYPNKLVMYDQYDTVVIDGGDNVVIRKNNNNHYIDEPDIRPGLGWFSIGLLIGILCGIGMSSE